MVTTRSCSLRGALRATALGVVSLAGLGVLLHLSLRDPLPPPIDPDTPFYEFRGEEALAPLPSVFGFEHQGRRYETLRLEPNQSSSWAVPDLPQLVTLAGALPPTRRVMWYSGSVNERGLRGPRVYDHQRPPGVYRIGVIGTGVTFGEGVDDDHTFCHLLEQRLNEAPPIDRSFEVINFGIPCMLTDLAEATFIRHSSEYEVDLWIVALGVNDALPMFHRPLADYRQNVRNLIRRVEDAGAEALVVVEPANSFYPWMQQYVQYSEALEEDVAPRFEMVDTPGILDCHERRDGLRLEVQDGLQQVAQYRKGERRVVYEARYQAEPMEQYLSPEIYEYLDTHEVWIGTFITDVHLNERGNGIVAESLYRSIAARLSGEPPPSFERCPLVNEAERARLETTPIPESGR